MGYHPDYKTSTHDPIVYYLVNADRPEVVKIGTTVNAEKRLKRYFKQKPHITYKVIAWEYGDASLEGQRHRQFERSNLIGEWFWLTPDLEHHLNSLVRPVGAL
jgi:hypothetical protein